MSRFEIYKNNVENSSVEITVNTNDINAKIYNTLTNGEYDSHVDIKTAIDIACWCKLASVGEVYETNDLTVIVIE